MAKSIVDKMKVAAALFAVLLPVVFASNAFAAEDIPTSVSSFDTGGGEVHAVKKQLNKIKADYGIYKWSFDSDNSCLSVSFEASPDEGATGAVTTPTFTGRPFQDVASEVESLKLEGFTDVLEVSSSYFTSIDSVTIGSEIESIKQNAFQNISSLTTITIESGESGSRLQTIESNAFAGTSVFSLDLSKTSIESLGVGESDPAGPFAASNSNNASLTEIKLPPTLKTLGRYALAFCDKLETLDLSALNNLSTFPLVLSNIAQG